MYKRERFQLVIQEEFNTDEKMLSELEILFVIEGEITINVESKMYELGTEDLLVINANKRHSIVRSSGLLLMKMIVDEKLIREAFDGQEVLIFCDPSMKANKKYQELRNQMKLMLKHSVETDRFDQSFGFYSDCYRVINLMTANFMVRISEDFSHDEDDRYEERINRINNYINSNYDQDINLKELSEKLYLSNGYLSRFFKKNYGMSFANYLTKVRLFHAVDQLIYTDDSITMVAHNCGFASAAFFNKVFRTHYGVSPTEYRKKAAAKSQERKINDSEKLKKRINEWVYSEENKDFEPIQQDKCVTIEREIKVSKGEVLEHTWGDAMNFGSAENLLHSSVREHLVDLQKKMGFRYVRFWGLFTNEFYIRPEEVEYDFSQIDIVLDFVLEQGLLPYIELETKPDVILHKAKLIQNRGSELKEFDHEEWIRLIRAFMRHLSLRYGKETLEGWRMELWFDERYRVEESLWPEYFRRFKETRAEIKKYNSLIEVGGYGIRMDLSAKTKRNFLSRWIESGAKPDFISIMFYGYEKGNDSDLDIYSKRTTDDDSFLHLIEREKKLICDLDLENVPIYVCEWNLTPSVRNFLNDTNYKGAYIVKSIIDLYGLVESMAYGAGSDRQYASFDTPGLMFGGNGLVTKDGILKPAAFALQFMNDLCPYYIGKDRNYMVTTDRYDNYAIICHNQQTLNYNYYLTEESELDRTMMWKYYEGRHRLKLNLKLTGLAEGQYRVKVYRVNHMYGSLLDVWSDMNFENELSVNDIAYLRRICEPQLSIRTVEVLNGTIDLEEELLINEIALIRVRKVDA